MRADAVELALHDRAQVSFNDVAFILRFVRPSAHVTVNTLEEHDFTFFKITSICLMAFFALVAAMVLTPLGFGGDGDDIFGNPSKYVKMMIKPEKKDGDQKVQGSLRRRRRREGEGEGRQVRQAGREEARRRPLQEARGRPEEGLQPDGLDVRRQLARPSSKAAWAPASTARSVVCRAARASVMRRASAGSARAAVAPAAAARASGLGGLGTKGGGRGRGGYGSIDLGGKGKDSTRVIPGKTTVVGGLDKDVIMKVIKRHQNEIKFCYEQELQKNPALGGKVAVAWTIDPAGGVSEANVSESSIGNANVESCIVQRIRRWKFPEPAGGGVVNVTFPWIFKAAGDDSEGE